MQEADVVCLPRGMNLCAATLLRWGEGGSGVARCFAVDSQTAHFGIVGFKNPFGKKPMKDVGREPRLFEECVARDFVLALSLSVVGVFKKAKEKLLLLGGAFQAVAGFVEGAFVLRSLIRSAQTDALLRQRAVSSAQGVALNLETRGKGSLQHLALGAEVVVGNPLPQGNLCRQDNGLGV